MVLCLVALLLATKLPINPGPPVRYRLRVVADSRLRIVVQGHLFWCNGLACSQSTYFLWTCIYFLLFCLLYFTFPYNEIKDISLLCLFRMSCLLFDIMTSYNEQRHVRRLPYGSTCISLSITIIYYAGIHGTCACMKVLNDLTARTCVDILCLSLTPYAQTS